MTPTAANPLKPGEKRRYIARVRDAEGNHPRYGDDWFRVLTNDNLTGMFGTRKWAQDALERAKATYRYGDLVGHTDDVVVPAPGPTLATIKVDDYLRGNITPVMDVPLAFRAQYRDTLARAALAAYRYGHTIYVNSSFRTRREQERLYDEYINHGGPLASLPGTSMHERGLALDIPNARLNDELMVELRKVGLIDDVPSEIWHVTNHAPLRRSIAGVERTFNWISRHDDRSRDYPVTAMLETEEPTSLVWATTTTLDQGREGACTGFGTAHELNAEPDPAEVTASLAQVIYERAKQLDEWPGESYEGSSVLAAVKAASEMGFYVNGYRWAFDEYDLALAVSSIGPAIIGVPWLEGMSDVDTDGFIHATGEVRGGHCLLVRGIDVERDAYLLHNSWGSQWGVRGNFELEVDGEVVTVALEGDAWISRADMRKLLADHGEACIPIR